MTTFFQWVFLSVLIYILSKSGQSRKLTWNLTIVKVSRFISFCISDYMRGNRVWLLIQWHKLKQFWVTYTSARDLWLSSENPSYVASIESIFRVILRALSNSYHMYYIMFDNCLMTCYDAQIVVFAKKHLSLESFLCCTYLTPVLLHNDKCESILRSA